MELAVSVTVTMIGEDGSQCPVGGELAAALAGPAQQFASMLTWAAGEAGALDHGDRETAIAESGRSCSGGCAEIILKLRAVVVNGDLDDYMDYRKARYRTDIHLSRYDPDSIAALGLIA